MNLCDHYNLFSMPLSNLINIANILSFSHYFKQGWPFYPASLIFKCSSLSNIQFLNLTHFLLTAFGDFPFYIDFLYFLLMTHSYACKQNLRTDVREFVYRVFILKYHGNLLFYKNNFWDIPNKNSIQIMFL